ncbi:NADP-dependent isocitrate dehydrogenase [Synechococcus moorigangaii CMS01]|nr:NADP-dependent isocitrate dehydrogenase [Synechococcus moorigangaii CMS01]
MNHQPSPSTAFRAATRVPVPVTVAHGDGIGPEIMEACLRILEAAGACIAPEPIEIGEKVYLRGVSAGIEPEAWESLRRTKVFYKAPITTPQGGGFKSLNVTVRKSLGMFANVRPCASLHPFVETKHPGMDVVIIRENEEDLYAGIEHRQTDEVYQCLKLFSRPATERIIRYAFEYARANGRRKVTCFSKDNIMKLTDGLYHRIFDEIAPDYPEIEAEHWIIDIGAARLAANPGQFDVIVMANLYGDILSDVAAEITGSVGLGGSANIGEHCSMFEAIHGSAPRRAGQNSANPSGLLLAGVQMLTHIRQGEAAARVHNAWARTIEDGIHTSDIFRDATSRQLVTTSAFADAVIARLGEMPSHLPAVSADGGRGAPAIPAVIRRTPQKREMAGIDVFVHWTGDDPDTLARAVSAAVRDGGPELVMISNRGVKVWPDGLPETFRTDHWRCRFMFDGLGNRGMVAQLMVRLAREGIDFIKTEQLYNFDGKPGFSLGQGQ